MKGIELTAVIVGLVLVVILFAAAIYFVFTGAGSGTQKMTFEIGPVKLGGQGIASIFLVTSAGLYVFILKELMKRK